MSAETLPTSGRLRAAFDRLLDVPYRDPDQRRRGMVFNALLSTGVLTSLVLMADVQLLGYWYPVFNPTFLTVILLLNLGVYGLAYAANKRGYLEVAARLYIALLTVLVLLVVFLYDGLSSLAIGVFMWLFVAAIGTLPLRAGLITVGATLLTYGGISILQVAGLYTPPFTLSAELKATGLGLITVTTSAGAALVVALFIFNLQQQFEEARQTARQLDELRQTLEQRVAARTEEARQQAQRFQVIAELGSAMTAILDLEQLMARAANFIAERLGYDHVGIFLLDKDRQWAVLRAASSAGGKRMLARGHRLHVGVQGIVGNVAFTGLPRIALHVDADPAWVRNPDLPDTRSEMALPLVVREQIIGVLDIQSRHPEAFSPEDVRTLRVLADGLAIAIENARLLTEMQQALDRLRVYQAQDVVEAWREALRRHRDVFAYESVYDAVIPVEAEEAPQLEEMPEHAESSEVEGRHRLQVPVSVRGTRVGLLQFDTARPWRPEEVRLAELVAEQLGLALDNARLLEESRLRALNERARGAIVARLRASSNVDAVLRNLVQEVGRALNTERVRVQLMPVEERGEVSPENHEAR